MNKEERKAYRKAYYQAHREQMKAATKAWKEAHKEQVKAANKAWCEANKDQVKVYQKAWYEANKDQVKAWKEAHKEQVYAYNKADVNSLGQTKLSIRKKSNYYLKKYGTKIDGYEIHHCCTYTEPYKFIYCSREMHRLIHSYLRQHNIDADSNHYEYIKHLLDDTAFKYNIE